MCFELKKKLCTLSVLCCLSLTPVLAEDLYPQENLRGFIQEYKMKDLTPEYISSVEMLLNEQCNNGNFETAEKTADYFVDVTKKYYGKNYEKTAFAYLKLAGLYRDKLIIDKAFENINKAQSIIKRNKNNQNLKNALYNEYVQIYSQINQPFDAITYMVKIPDEQYSSASELAAKYKRIAELYVQAGDYKNASQTFKKAIDIFNSNSNTNKYELMGTYSELSDISNYIEAKKCIDSLIAVANSFPAKDIGVRIDAQLKKLQNQSVKNKKQLDELAVLIEKNKNPFQQLSMAWLYIAYYYEQNNPKMEKKYRDYVNKFHQEFDWSKVPANSLKLAEKYEHEINSSFWNYDEAQKKVDSALDFIAPVKKYVPVIYSKFLVKGAQVNLANGNYKKAKKYIKEAQKTLNKTLEEPKYQIAELYDLYSEFYGVQNDKENALEYNSKAVDKFIELKGENNDETAGRYLKTASIYLDMGNKVEAAKYADKFLASVINKYGKNNIRTYDSMFNLSNFYRNIDENKADELYKEVLSGLNSGKVEGIYPILYYSVFISEAHNAVGIKNYALAVKYAEKSLKYAHNKGQKLDAYDILSYSYSILGKKQSASKYLKLKASLQ